MTKKKLPSTKNDDSKTYRTIAIIFLITGLALMIPEGSRMTGLPFVVLGFTFFILSQEKPKE